VGHRHHHGHHQLLRVQPVNVTIIWARQMLKRFRKKKSVAADQLVPNLPPEGQVPTGAEQIPPPAPLELDPTNQNTTPLESCPTPAVATTLSLSSAARQVASERETAQDPPTAD